MSNGEIDINLEIEIDLAGFMGDSDNSVESYKDVRMNAIVKGNLTDEQVQELGKKVDARCPILVLLKSSGCNIISTWSY